MSNDIPPSLNKFRGELERALKSRLERPPSHKRPRLLAGTTLGFAAGATALALVLTAASSSPAFAVTRNHDGTVSVRIMRLEGLRGANKRLAEMNLHVRLTRVPVPAGCPMPVAVKAPPGARLPLPGRPLQFRIAPSKIPRGRTLVLRTIVAAPVPPKQGLRGGLPGRLPPVPPAMRGRAIPCAPLPPPPCAWQVGHAPQQILPPPGPPAFLHKPPHPVGPSHAVQVPACKVALAPPPGQTRAR